MLLLSLEGRGTTSTAVVMGIFSRHKGYLAKEEEEENKPLNSHGAHINVKYKKRGKGDTLFQC